MDCPRIAIYGVKELGVGLCKDHANELLTAAILLKMTATKRKKPLQAIRQGE